MVAKLSEDRAKVAILCGRKSAKGYFDAHKDYSDKYLMNLIENCSESLTREFKQPINDSLGFYHRNCKNFKDVYAIEFEMERRIESINRYRHLIELCKIELMNRKLFN